MSRKRKLIGEAREKQKHLVVRVENFGPIVKGEVDVRPLTIFIGPNGCGKTYLSSVIFAHEKLQAEQAMGTLIDELVSLMSRREVSKGALVSLLDRVKSNAVKGLRKLLDRIPRQLGVEGGDIVRLGTDKARVSITSDLGYINCCWHIDGQSRANYRVSSKAPQEGITLSEYDKGKIDELVQKMGELTREGEDISPLLAETLKAVKARALQEIFLFIPDGRTGLLKSMGYLLQEWIKQVRILDDKDALIRGGLRGLDIEFVEAWFGLVRQMERREQNLPDLPSLGVCSVRVGEKAWVHGIEKIYVKTTDNREMPLNRASSGVTETIPLLLLTSGAREKALIVVDEPEAHLHPKAQTELAVQISRWVRSGKWRFVLATHSDFLIDQFSNLVVRSSIPKKHRPKAGIIMKDDELRPDDIAIYNFKYDEEKKGYRVVRVKIDPKEGVEEEEFSKVRDALYDEYEELWNIQHRILEESSGE